MKSVTWRVGGVLILGGITYGFTRDVAQTTGITLIFHAVRFALYYLHERAWDRTNWGRVTHPLAHIRVRPDLTEDDHSKIRRFFEEHDYLPGRDGRRVCGLTSNKVKQPSALAG